ncbi:hypothetical protein CCP3SC1AL1_1360001 [Gammaproteobacteria bacterium]
MLLPTQVLDQFKPKLVYVDGANRIKHVRDSIEAQKSPTMFQANT